MRKKTPSYILTLTLLMLFPFASANATLEDLEKEVQSILKTLKMESAVNEKEAINELQWSGISDQRIFDIMAKRLLAGMGTKEKAQVERMSFLAKGLALSGDSKYAATLEKVIAGKPHKKLKKWAESSLKKFADNKKWNAIILKNASQAPAGKLGQWRARNMLQSKLPVLIRVGAKRIYYKYPGDKTLPDLAEQVLLANYNKKLDGHMTDALAWICKALGQTGNSKYKQTLTKVAKGKNSKIAKYAKKNMVLL